MTPYEIYEKRIEEFRDKADILQRRENMLSVARLASFFAGFVLFVALFSVSTVAAVASLLTCLVLFVWLVDRHLRTSGLKERYRSLQTINEKELLCLHGDFLSFPDGAVYADRCHPYSYDLDIFGHSSLFQFLNRTTSRPASDMLASWLMHPATIKDIELRQEAVRELAPMIGWRQDVIAAGYINSRLSDDPGHLLKWLSSDNSFNNRRVLKAITVILSLLGLASTALVIAGMPVALLTPALVINFLFYFSQGKKISQLHTQVTRSADILEAYSGTIRLIERQPFDSSKLKELRATFLGDESASMAVRRLSRLVNRLDTRLNVMVSIPLNLLFFWDIHCCMALERWKGVNGPRVSEWFRVMAETEVLASLANTAFNNPSWAFPVVMPEYFVMEAENTGHPLIPEERRICNSFTAEGQGRTILVTGSNMAGKSTFLRTCGINTVMALAGCPVCATAFRISHIQVWTSMRISDSLEDNTSSFYAELKRLAAIIEEAKVNRHLFLLLDEILRGTNSNDRYTGSVALIKQLQENDTVAVVATHDLRLAELEEETPGRVDNYHFDVKIKDEELFFDYRLTPGICQSLNASILMKKMGIRV